MGSSTKRRVTFATRLLKVYVGDYQSGNCNAIPRLYTLFKKVSFRLRFWLSERMLASRFRMELLLRPALEGECIC